MMKLSNWLVFMFIVVVVTSFYCGYVFREGKYETQIPVREEQLIRDSFEAGYNIAHAIPFRKKPASTVEKRFEAIRDTTCKYILNTKKVDEIEIMRIANEIWRDK